MARVRFYSGKFRPGVDRPVQPNQALTISQFSSLPLDKQSDILSRGYMSGDKGCPDPSWDVPIYAQRHVTLGEIQQAFQHADQRLRAGISRHQSAEKMRSFIQSKHIENEPSKPD